MTVKNWLERACEDADARGLPELKPLLETLAASTESLREADAIFNHPATTAGETHDDDPV
jgi:hypothetical protein